MSDVTEIATISNYRTIRGVLFTMKEACPVNCDVNITLDDDGSIHLQWRWNIKRKPFGFELCINPSREHLMYLEIERAKDAIRREYEIWESE